MVKQVKDETKDENDYVGSSAGSGSKTSRGTTQKLDERKGSV
jgi:hypothetical protein